MIAEQEADRERPDKAREDGGDGGFGIGAAFDFARDEVGDDLAVGLRVELATFGKQLFAEDFEILDDAVVDQRNRTDDVRVGVADGRLAMGCPAGVGDADVAGERFGIERSAEILELALGAAAFELAVDDGTDTGRVITAIFEPLEPGEQAFGDG